MKRPESHYCSKKEQDIELQLGFNYRVIEKAGEGSYGQVYKIFDLENLRLLIVKLNKKSKDNDKALFFRTQHNILSQISRQIKDMHVGEYVKEPSQEYFSMDCFGPNLEDTVAKYTRLSTKTVKHIGLKATQQLEILHRIGYLHRDIKTQNILVGNQHTLHNIYLIDYGLALKYRERDTQIPKKKYQGLVGTARYASVAAHQLTQQSPKDDLESLGYVMLFCLQGFLEWQDLKIENKLQRFKKIGQLKKSSTIKDLGFSFPFLIKYFKHVKSLKYSDQPDYGYLKSLFSPVMKSNECFEWCDTTKCKCRSSNIEHNCWDSKTITYVITSSP